MRPNGTFQLLAGGIEAFVPRYVYTVGGRDSDTGEKSLEKLSLISTGQTFLLLFTPLLAVSLSLSLC